MARLYILRWNPTFSMKYENHLVGMKMLRENLITSNWSIYEYEELRAGDFFIFNMVGCGAQDGIAGFGQFISEPAPAPNWRADDGTMRQYADFAMYGMIDRRQTDIFCAAEMEAAFPEINWHSGHAGVPVDAMTAERLLLYIMQHTIFLKEPTSKISFPPFDCRYPLAPFFAECIDRCCPQYKEMIMALGCRRNLMPDASDEEIAAIMKAVNFDRRCVIPDIDENTVITPDSTLKDIAGIFVAADIDDLEDEEE